MEKRPTVEKVKIFCEGCDAESHVFFTRKEILENVKIHQQCNSCNKFTKWLKN